MAIQILPRDMRYAELGAGIGGLLGGLGGEMASRKEKKALAEHLKSLGIPADEAQSISEISPNLQQKAIEGYMAKVQAQRQAQEQERAAQMYQQLIGGGLQQPPPMQQPPVQQPPMQQPPVQQPPMQQPPVQQPPMQQPPVQQMPVQQAQDEAGEVEGEIEEGGIIPRDADINAVKELTPSMLYGQLIANGVSKKDAQELVKEYAKEWQEKSKEALLEKKSELKVKEGVQQKLWNTKEEFDSKIETAKKQNEDFGVMKELIKKGNLPPALVASMFQSVKEGIFGFGINLDSMMGADAEQYKKIVNTFIGNIKNIFGGKVSNLEMMQFLETLPTLMQSDAGKLRIIKMLKAANNGIILKGKIQDQILKENKYNMPMNFNELVTKRMDKHNEKLANEFKKSISTASEKKKIKEYQKNPSLLRTGEVMFREKASGPVRVMSEEEYRGHKEPGFFAQMTNPDVWMD